MEFSLDHISLEVDNVDRQKKFIENDLGFLLNYAKRGIVLDRWYIEVWSPEEPTTDRSKFPNSVSFYLRVDNIDALWQERAARQLPLKEPVEYISKSGAVWHDVEFYVPGLEALLPIIVQPLRPEDLVQTWPFPLQEAHPNGLRSIAACHLMTSRHDELIDVFSHLLDQPKPRWHENRFFETEQAIFYFANGALIICKPARSVLAQTYLTPAGEGLFALTLKSGNLQQTHRFFAENQFDVREDEFGTYWLRPKAELNFFLGYRDPIYKANEIMTCTTSPGYKDDRVA